MSSHAAYVSLPSLTSSHSSRQLPSYLSTYAPPVKQPASLQASQEEAKQQLPSSLSPSPRSLPSSGPSSRRSSLPPSQQSSRPQSSALRSALSSSSSVRASRQGKSATFSEHLPSLTFSFSPEQSADILFLSTSSISSSPPFPSSSISRAESLIREADDVFSHQQEGEDVESRSAESRRRAAMLSVLKRADRERVDMARDLYDEVQMALNEQAREDEERRREEREQREREEERKRLKDERRREKREAHQIQTLSAAQMIRILDAFPALPPAVQSLPPASPAAPHTLQSFLCEHYALQHLMFTNAPQSSSLSPASALMTVDWVSPPAFRHVLSRRFVATDFPSYLHAELDSLDPSATSLLGFLRSWLRSYRADRAAFTSLLSFLTLKLAELQSLTAQLASPNALVTYISVDALLLLLSSSSLCSSQRAQVVLTLLLDIALLAVYAKHSDTGSGHVRVEDTTWAVRVRVLEGELAARKEEHRAVQRRMQSMHEQWLRVLHMWQPCVARAIRKWQLPIEALAFQYWACSHRRTCWRRAEPLPLLLPSQPTACDSMSRMLRTMRLRWARRNDARVVFLEWRQLSILSRLGMLRQELRRLDGINADKASELSSLASTASRYRQSIDGSEREVEDGQLRIRMMLVQHDEYSEQLQAYGVQEEETGRLVCLFSALMLRAVEECELALVQLFYQRGQDLSRLGEIESLDEAEGAAGGGGGGGDAVQGAAGGGAGETRDEKRRKTRLVLAGLLSKKKASSSRKARKAQEQDSKAFLRVWLRFHYARLAHLFPPASAQPRMPADTDVLVAASPPSHARHRSVIAPVAPSLFSLATELTAAASTLPSRPPTGRRCSSVSHAGGAVDVAAAFLNALRQQSHAVFPLPPFSHDSAFLHHHSHPPLLYEDDSGDDEDVRRRKEADRRKEREDRAMDAESGLPLELVRLLSVAHPAEAQSLRSLFSFMPELVLPASPSLTAEAGSSLVYSLPFVQPASLRAPHFLLQSIALLPQLLAPAASASSSAAKQDAELLHDASSLYLLLSFPATPFDLDDELCHLQELIALTREFAQAGRSAFLRLHSDVMRVVLVNVRLWRRRMKRRREEMRGSDALWWRHVRRGEEELTRRMMRRIREKEAIMKAANIAYERLPADTAGSLTAAAGKEVDRVESAFGEVEVEAQVELDISAPSGQAEDAKETAKRKRTKGGKVEAKKQLLSAPSAAGSAAVQSAAEVERLRSASSAASGSSDVSAEYEQEKAEDEAENSQLHYDSDRLRDVLAQAAEKVRAKQAEDRERKEKKAKKGAKAKEQPGEPAKEPAAAADGGGAEGDDRKEDGRDAAAAEEEEDDLLAEDESVQCEETMLQYIIDLRRLFRNACETDETGGTADAAAATAAAAASSGSAARDAASSSSGSQWLLSKVHFGRLIRKYKILSKSCSAQFIDGLWEEKQSSKRGGSGLIAADGSDSSAAAAAAAADDGVTFDDFLELLIRIAVTKYAAEATLLSRVSALLTRDLFPAVKGPSPLADFRTVLALTCEPVFDKHNKFLSQMFRAYSSDRESSGGVQEPAMTRRDFDEFIEHTALLSRKLIAVRTVAVLWGSAQMDEEGEGGDSGALFGGSSSMVYWEFLEAIAAMSCYYERDPLLPVDSRLDQFVHYLQDGCALVETKRRMYAAKMQGDKGSGGVGGAGAATSSAVAAAGASK